jgi:hypothetical protein
VHRAGVLALDLSAPVPEVRDGHSELPRGIHHVSLLGNACREADYSTARAQFHVLVLTWDGVSQLKLFEDGAAHGAFTSVTAESATGAWRIGVAKDGASRAFDGDLAELAVYNRALSDAARKKLECTLGAKYGITVPGC